MKYYTKTEQNKDERDDHDIKDEIERRNDALEKRISQSSGEGFGIWESKEKTSHGWISRARGSNTKELTEQRKAMKQRLEGTTSKRLKEKRRHCCSSNRIGSELQSILACEYSRLSSIPAASYCYCWIHVVLVTKHIRNKALRHKVYIWVMDRASKRVSDWVSEWVNMSSIPITRLLRFAYSQVKNDRLLNYPVRVTLALSYSWHLRARITRVRKKLHAKNVFPTLEKHEHFGAFKMLRYQCMSDVGSKTYLWIR